MRLLPLTPNNPYYVSESALDLDKLLEDPDFKAALNTRYMTQAEPVLKPWFAALAGRNTAHANIVTIGDSISDYYQSSTFNSAWTRRLQRNLRAALPCDIVTGIGRGFIAPARSGSSIDFTWPAVLSGGAVLNGGWGPNVCAVILSSAAKTITYTLQGTSAEVVYAGGPSSGVFGWSVDGGAVTNVSAVRNPLAGGWRSPLIPLGASGVHTLVLTWVSGASLIEGIIEYDGDATSGIMVHACGNASETAVTWQGFVANSYILGSIAALKPDLVLIELGTNDMALGTTLAQFPVSLESVVSTIVNRCQTDNGNRPPVVLIAGAKPGGANNASWPQYVALMKAVADSAPTERLFIDQSVRMSEYTADTSATWVMMSSHPNDKGMAMKADILTTALLPR